MKYIPFLFAIMFMLACSSKDKLSEINTEDNQRIESMEQSEGYLVVSKPFSLNPTPMKRLELVFNDNSNVENDSSYLVNPSVENNSNEINNDSEVTSPPPSTNSTEQNSPPTIIEDKPLEVVLERRLIKPPLEDTSPQPSTLPPNATLTRRRDSMPVVRLKPIIPEVSSLIEYKAGEIILTDLDFDVSGDSDSKERTDFNNEDKTTTGVPHHLVVHNMEGEKVMTKIIRIYDVPYEDLENDLRTLPMGRYQVTATNLQTGQIERHLIEIDDPADVKRLHFPDW